MRAFTAFSKLISLCCCFFALSKSDLYAQQNPTPQTADIAALHGVNGYVPRMFCDALKRHFPLNELAKGELTPRVIALVRNISDLATHHATEDVVNGQVNPAQALCVFLRVVVQNDCPPEIRRQFVAMIDSLLKLYVRYPDDERFPGLLSMLLSHVWVGWTGGPARWADEEAAVENWHQSEIYRHLIEGGTPKSKKFKESISAANKKTKP